jgi:hypothetical protein
MLKDPYWKVRTAASVVKKFKKSKNQKIKKNKNQKKQKSKFFFFLFLKNLCFQLQKKKF